MPLLYMDALNFSHKFFPRSAPWDLEESFRRLQKFVEACRNSGHELRVFIDASIQSEEGMAKWRSRRVAEVRKMDRSMPQGLQLLQGEMFQELGVVVHYSVDTDLDDAIAFFAEADGAAVLSADHDFFRYIASTFSLFKDFHVERRRLKLTTHDGCLKPGVTRRPLGPKPETEARTPAFIDVKRTGRYVRGAPSPLVKVLGNPHAAARILRQAMYLRLGLREVREVFPSWDGSDVVWSDDVVTSDGAREDLLDRPDHAIAILFPELQGPRPAGVDEAQWAKHAFAVHAVVHELCCAANGSSFFRTMLNDEGLRAAMGAWCNKSKGKGKW
eukprot:CAMPEP_0179062392 /NCGR_PEP_ID=MMETSP0796-20121207/26905_1 /TAXON_ID=73915 /ORGANISM="Pyrodinium bahamense, Strain pbaha01" /LENGTH=328 /DNA_ID=CAMNT_0020759299 /DNA_START=50 /DNA_END=1033 /DNA_ORIENTATION=+